MWTYKEYIFLSCEFFSKKLNYSAEFFSETLFLSCLSDKLLSDWQVEVLKLNEEMTRLQNLVRNLEY